ncbi:MAG: transposase [Candidatus Zixiibacteriota bacterium]|jgi:putative transposase
MRRLRDFDYSRKPVYITTDTFERKALFVRDSRVEKIYEALDEVYPKYEFKVNGFVIMPTHCHFIIVSENNDLSDIMHDAKGICAFRMLDCGLVKGKLWQRGFYDHVIRNRRDLVEKLNYIHLNPLRAGLVDDPSEYRHSSYQFYYSCNDCNLPTWFERIGI